MVATAKRIRFITISLLLAGIVSGCSSIRTATLAFYPTHERVDIDWYAGRALPDGYIEKHSIVDSNVAEELLVAMDGKSELLDKFKGDKSALGRFINSDMPLSARGAFMLIEWRDNRRWMIVFDASLAPQETTLLRETTPLKESQFIVVSKAQGEFEDYFWTDELGLVFDRRFAPLRSSSAR